MTKKSEKVVQKLARSDARAAVETRFGGVFLDELIRRVGPIVAELLMRWLLGNPGIMDGMEKLAAAHAGATMSDVLIDFLLNQVEANRETFLKFLHDQTDLLFDLLLAHLRSSQASA